MKKLISIILILISYHSFGQLVTNKGVIIDTLTKVIRYNNMTYIQDTANVLVRNTGNNDTTQFTVRDFNQLNNLSYTGGQPVTIVSGAAHFVRSSRQSLFAPTNQSLMIDTLGRGFLISCWARIQQVDSNQVFVSKDDDLTTAGSEYLLGFVPAYGSFAFQIETNTTTRFVIAPIGIPTLNTWYYLQAWYDPSGTPSVNIKVNNGTTTTTSFAETTFHNTSTPFTIGSDAYFYSAASNSWLNGDLKNVRLFKRPLTTAEGTLLYNSGTPLPYASIPNSLLSDPLFISSWDFLDIYNIGADSR